MLKTTKNANTKTDTNTQNSSVLSKYSSDDIYSDTINPKTIALLRLDNTR